MMRSLLFVPAHNMRYLQKAASCQADVLLLDLEDSVPHDLKAEARAHVQSFAKSGSTSGKPVFVRINDLDSGEMLEDVCALCGAGICGFLLPKVGCADDIRHFAWLLDLVEREKRLAQGSTKIIALIENAAAVMNAREICAATSRLIAVAFGREDYLTDINVCGECDLLFARHMIVNAACASGIVPIDTIHPDVNDLEDLRKCCQNGRAIGFKGALAINPKEIDIINNCYSITEQEISWAKEVLSIAAGGAEEKKNVSLKGRVFVGPPVVRRAHKIVSCSKGGT